MKCTPKTCRFLTRHLSLALVVATSVLTLVLVSSAAAQPTEKTLVDFEVQSMLPSGAVIFDGKGHLFGASFGIGKCKCLKYKSRGLVYELIQSKKGKWSKTAIYTFVDGDGGGNPLSTLIFDSAGNLYGTGSTGGTADAGVVFELSPIPLSKNKWSEKVLWSFDGHAGGASPQAGLIFDSLGNLYGTTAYGGAYGDGTVFELSPSPGGNWIQKVLYSFAGSDGSTPVASLISDSRGNLYGTTKAGGGNGFCIGGCGTVFSLTPGPNGAWVEETLYSFESSSNGDGNEPLGGLVFDKSGNLYGTTFYGGQQNGGVLFQLTPGDGSTWRENVIHSFCITVDCNDGFNSAAGLTFDSAGNLYGTTEGNDNGGGGTVFKFSPDGNGGWTESLLYNFSVGGSDGWLPAANLIFDGAGNLYGTTLAGGKWPQRQGRGTVFEILP